MQSAYRRFQSTETAVTKVYNDLLLAADVGQVSVLCLLDLTAAFDTVDHQLLLHRLERQYGLHGVVLAFFSSYLTDPFGSRTMVICVLRSMSCAQFHKVQSSVRDYSHSIQRILMK